MHDWPVGHKCREAGEVTQAGEGYPKKPPIFSGSFLIVSACCQFPTSKDFGRHCWQSLSMQFLPESLCLVGSCHGTLAVRLTIKLHLTVATVRALNSSSAAALKWKQLHQISFPWESWVPSFCMSAHLNYPACPIIVVIMIALLYFPISSN